jgi:hypothetical protein
MQRDRHSSSLLRSATRLASCLPLLLLPACGGGEETGTEGGTTTAARPVPLDLPDPHPVFGDPLVVDGELIPFERIKQHLVMGKYGNPALENRKHKILIDNELKRREAAGEDITAFKVEQAAIDEAIQTVEKQIADEFPEGEVTLDEIYPHVKPSQNRSLLEERVRVTKLFDKVFLPENPYEFPPVTVEALGAAELEIDLVQSLKDQWDQKQADADQAGPEEPQDAAGQAFFQQMQRQLLLEHMAETVKVEFPDDGLPPEVAMRVDGIDILVDDLWQEIGSLVTAQDIEMSKKWLVNVALAKKALEEAGYWLDDEEYDLVYKEYHDPYKDSPFSYEKLALSFKGFPSLIDYRTYFRIYKSYERMIQEEITDEALLKVVDRLNLLLYGRLDADVILVSAYDFETRQWRENGWEEADRRATEILREIVEGMDWDAAVEEYSEFREIPIAKSQRDQPARAGQLKQDKGRYRDIKRNDLMKLLEENEYGVFLECSSLSDHIFFQLEPGEYVQPRKGPYGYYIPLVKRRVLTRQDVDVITNPTHRQLATQDLVTGRLNQYMWELRSKADIRGL